MDNISSCINGFRNATPPLVHFKPDDIAPFLLPKLHQLVSVLPKPIDSVMQFAEDVVSCPPMAKALALSGDCPRLADYLIQANDFVNRLAMSSLRQMIRSVVGCEERRGGSNLFAKGEVVPNNELGSPILFPYSSPLSEICGTNALHTSGQRLSSSKLRMMH